MKTTKDLNGLQITELPHVFTRSKFSGGSLTRTFKGTEQQIITKEEEMLDAGYVTKRTQGPLWTLECVIQNVDASGTPTTAGGGTGGDTAGYVTDDGLQIVWEITPQIAEKDLLESNTSILMRRIPDRYKKYLKDLNARTDNPNKMFYAMPDKDLTYQNHVDAYACWNLLYSGVTTVDINYPVLRRTITPPRAYSLLSLSYYVNRVFSWSTLVATEGVPNNFAQILPAYYYPDMTYNVTINGMNFAYGYKKSPLTVQQISATNNQVQQEWTFGLYSTDLYGPLL